jgi:hypothetical protein
MVQSFTVGGLVGRTFSAWVQNFGRFTAIGLLSTLPSAAALHVAMTRMMGWSTAAPAAAVVEVEEAAAFAAPTGAPDESALLGVGVLMLVAAAAGVVLGMIELAALAHGTFGHLRGQRVSLGSMVATGLRRGLPAILVGLVVWLATTAGTLLLIVPGVFLGCALAVAIPAAVVERGGVGKALSRSFSLTRGYRWRILGGFLALLGLVYMIAFAAQVVAGIAVGFASAFLGATGPTATGATLLVAQAGNLLVSPILGVGLTVAYHDLRAAKEGLDTSQIAAVFD